MYGYGYPFWNTTNRKRDVMTTDAIDWAKTPHLYINYKYSEEDGIDNEWSEVEDSYIIQCHPAIFFRREKAKNKERKYRQRGYQLLAMVPMTKDEYQQYVSEKSVLERKLN